jgi:ATP-dependent Clp protease ATP-binding subunit ClpC
VSTTDRLNNDSRDVLRASLRQALSLGYNYIQPEHILLALLREPEGVTARAIAELGLKPSALRGAVLKVLSEDLTKERETPP